MFVYEIRIRCENRRCYFSGTLCYFFVIYVYITSSDDNFLQKVKARVKELPIPRYKIICLVHIGELNNQGLRISSRCLWNAKFDTFATYEFKNHSLFAVACVYGVYFE